MRSITSKPEPTKYLNMIHRERGRDKVAPSQLMDVGDGGRIVNRMRYDDLLEEITLTNPGIDLMTLPMAHSRTKAGSIIIKELVPAIKIHMREDKEVVASHHTQQAFIQGKYPIIQLQIIRDCQNQGSSIGCIHNNISNHPKFHKEDIYHRLHKFPRDLQ